MAGNNFYIESESFQNKETLQQQKIKFQKFCENIKSMLSKFKPQEKYFRERSEHYKKLSKNYLTKKQSLEQKLGKNTKPNIQKELDVIKKQVREIADYEDKLNMIVKVISHIQKIIGAINTAITPLLKAKGQINIKEMLIGIYHQNIGVLENLLNQLLDIISQKLAMEDFETLRNSIKNLEDLIKIVKKV